MRVNFGFGKVTAGHYFHAASGLFGNFRGRAGKSGQASQQNQYRGTKCDRQPRTGYRNGEGEVFEESVEAASVHDFEIVPQRQKGSAVKNLARSIGSIAC